jgi:Putative transposase/Transposase zinc-binding domain
MQKIYHLGVIMRTWGDEFIQKTNPHPTVRKAIFDIARCRTSKLGGRQIVCTDCGHTIDVFNSCGNRNCPICQSIKKEVWIDKTGATLLPVPHSHVVFPLPHQLNPLFFHNMKELYGMLFAAANKAVLQLCADPKWLGAKPGMLAVLHTWGANMAFHPHLHCILSAGGWDDKNQTWIQPKYLNSGFFIPQKVMAACFKKHFLFAFVQLWEEGNLLLNKELMHLNNPDDFKIFYNQIAFNKNWVVKIMPPLNNPQRVIDYLGRYIYRIAITDNRIKEVNLKERNIIFEYKDYAAQKDDKLPPPIKTLPLDALEFIRRFAQHVLPKSFQKARYFGIYATASRTKLLVIILAFLGKTNWHKNIRSVSQIIMAFTGIDPNICPCCGAKNLIVITIEPLKMPNSAPITHIITLNIRPSPMSF